MKVKKIFLYSHDGRIREVIFNLNGVNIITGAKSTGKSSIIDIIDYCSGRSECMISGGTISNKTSWVGTIFEFNDCSQIMVVKPLPQKNKKEVSKSFIKTGYNLSIPNIDELTINSNDELNLIIFGKKLNFIQSQTNISPNSSRNNYDVNFKHTKYYLFQPQNLIANKSLLFYSQEDFWKATNIKDTLPILLKADVPDRREIFNKIKEIKRNIKIIEKKIEDRENNIYRENQSILSLYKEAEIYGISKNHHENNIYKLSNILENLSSKNIPNNDPSLVNIYNIQTKISKLHKQRTNLLIELNSFKNFQENKNIFIKNRNKEYARMSILDSFILKDIEEDLHFFELVSILRNDLALAKENYIKESILESNLKISKIENNIREKIKIIDNEVENLSNELNILNEVSNSYKNFSQKERGINILLGKVKFYLLNHTEFDSVVTLRSLLINYKNELEALINESNGYQDPTDFIDSIIFRISSKISEYLKELSYEHSKNPTRFDLKLLTLFSTDEYDNLLPMNKVGSGANYLALHIATLLSLHYYFHKFKCSVPSFLILDQPTQVFFPPIISFNDIKKNIEEYNKNVDVQEVIKLFKFLIDFTNTEVPGFQIIITEHAYINEDWFKELMPEKQWIPPLALVPSSWPSLQSLY